MLKYKFPYVSAIDKASDCKFGMQLGFAKAHHQILSRRKSVRGPGLGELLTILGFPFNVSATAEASEYKFGMQLGFAKAHQIITYKSKVSVALH